MAMLAYRTEAQDFSASGPDAAKPHSRTFFECTLKAGDDTMNVPVQTCTAIGELREVTAAQMGVRRDARHRLCHGLGAVPLF
eukprot:CAMPEP_0175632704 /NCGR_PEP_ID=MMETSP0097-20121207/260_1 /TAXON_ID=311494 /ORGANISM="Alexandrium monilatum, Strain CCMP3105" /LENGTH=81 /DNA_ID=CAMNT_0016938213 /DNA_START=19 /DNA_END=261 /DNA_ORIENTATION=-